MIHGMDMRETHEPTEFLLAHRHRRHGASPATPEPAGVSPLSCRGVSSLYCGYTFVPRNMVYGKSMEAQMIRTSSSAVICISRMGSSIGAAAAYTLNTSQIVKEYMA